MFAVALFLVLSLVFQVDAIPHPVRRPLPRRWYHPPSHPIHRLFRRDIPSAAPGSPQWNAQYPNVNLPPLPEAQTPPEWLAALAAAESAGKIPNIPVTVPQTNASPQYPGGVSGSDPNICSSTWQCRGEGDIWDAPDGHVGIGFDDGPTYGSAKLYQYLQTQNQSATHFMIGINILNNNALFNEAYSTLNHDIAAHTWTHPYMTTQNNTQIVAQLGWTMQIIHDLTGGRLPRYWRPPYGDSDNRIRAIAREVFNITQIDWNHDSADWTIGTGATTNAQVESNIGKWYAGAKTPGLIILEHELTDNTSTAFINTYPVLKSNGWTPISVVQLFEGAWQNAADDEGAVESMDVVATTYTLPPSTTAAVTSTSTTPAASSHTNNKNAKTNQAPRRTTIPSSFLLACAATLLYSLR